MLEPLLRCNLACAGCGKIQHPAEILKRELSPEQCFRAAEECGAPIVSIPGGEPLLHSRIEEIVAGLVARRRYLYLCTNAIKLEEMLAKFRPSRYLAFSVHLDGPPDEHDRAVCRSGVYDVAVSAIRAARAAGFRVTTNTTLFQGVDVEGMRGHFDELMRMGVEGMMISPGYAYEKAPDQDGFLHRSQTVDLFRRLLANRPRAWKFNQTPLYLQFLQGRQELPCAPWGNPTYNVFGWQRPCYLLDEGHCESFAELMESTPWDAYGPQSGNAKCRDCMVHSGFEPAAVAATLGTWSGFWSTVRSALLPDRTAPDAASPARDVAFPSPAVQRIEAGRIEAGRIEAGRIEAGASRQGASRQGAAAHRHRARICSRSTMFPPIVSPIAYNDAADGLVGGLKQTLLGSAFSTHSLLDW